MRIFKPSERQIYCGVAVIIAVSITYAAVSSFVSRSRAKYQQFLILQEEVVRAVDKFEFVLSYDELTHWEREEWTIQTFFHSKDAVAACELISAKKTSELAEWITEGGDVNLTGEYGMTLLFWAMLDRNMKAFQCLLEKGANPDAVLNNIIPLKLEGALYHGESLMFAAIALKDYDFMLVAMPYTDRPNQLGIENHNLIQRLTAGFNYTSVRSYIYAKLVRSGVNPDVRNKYSSVPAGTLVSSGCPTACLAILIAGADPHFGSSDGESVIDELRRCKADKYSDITSPTYQQLIRWMIGKGFLEPDVLSDLAARAVEKEQTESANRAANNSIRD